MKGNREQKLVDICYQLVLTCLDETYSKTFKKMKQEEKAEWVTQQLKACGFPTSSVGSSYGVLLDEEGE